MGAERTACAARRAVPRDTTENMIGSNQRLLLLIELVYVREENDRRVKINRRGVGVCGRSKVKVCVPRRGVKLACLSKSKLSVVAKAHDQHTVYAY